MNKIYYQRLLFFIGSIIIGIEMIRFQARKLTLELIEDKSFLAQFVSENDNKFNLYHILTEYLPLIVFSFVTIVIINSLKPSKNIYLFLLPCIAALISSIAIFTISDKYYELCKSWFFTHQLAILGSYYFATLFVLKEVKIKARITYFLIAALFIPFSNQITQLIISCLLYNADFYFPFGKTHGFVLFVYLALAGLYLFLKKKKILESP